MSVFVVNPPKVVLIRLAIYLYVNKVRAPNFLFVLCDVTTIYIYIHINIRTFISFCPWLFQLIEVVFNRIEREQKGQLDVLGPM